MKATPPSDSQPGEGPTPAASEALYASEALSASEALQALAVGELDAQKAAALRARLEADPGLRAAFDDIETLEGRLQAEPLLPLPHFLVPRILAATTTATTTATTAGAREPAHVRPHILLARVAACALIAFASWLAFSGEMPPPVDAGTPGRLVAALPVPALGAALPVSLQTEAASVWAPHVANSESPSVVGTVMLSVVGLLLLVLGLAFARFSHLMATRTQRATPIPKATPIQKGGPE